MRSKTWRTAIGLAAAVALLVAILLVGWFWFGWGATAANRAILDALPLPPGVQKLGDHPHSIEDDEMFVTPPDGWAIRRTYRAPPGTTRDDILDFYISELSPQWQWCLRYYTWIDVAGEMGGEDVLGAHFTKGATQVSIDTLNLDGGRGPSYDIYVDNEETIHPCQGAELKDDDEATPR